MNSNVLLTVELTPSHAQALAQFVKRIGWAEMRVNAANDPEAFRIREAIDQIGRELADVGYGPR